MQARDAKPVPADESSQIPMAQQHIDGEIDSSGDGMPSPPLEAYTNRLRPFGVQFDAETDSDSLKPIVAEMYLIKQYVTNTQLLKNKQCFDMQ